MSEIDLHTHSIVSDGTLTPSELVRLAKDSGLKAIAVTDHDTVMGLPEAVAAGTQIGMEVIPGVELGVDYSSGSMHVVGLWLPSNGGKVAEALIELQNKRNSRNHRMIEKLQQAGVEITLEDVEKEAGDGVIVRPHFAMVLMKKGLVSSINEAFDTYIGSDGVGYVAKEKLSPAEGLALLKQENATTILAHPFTLHQSRNGLKKELLALKQQGLDGIEVYYSEHSQGQTKEYLEIAHELDLLVSGGSDFHGAVKPDIQLGRGKGNLSMPYALVQAMKEQRMNRGLSC